MRGARLTNKRLAALDRRVQPDETFQLVWISPETWPAEELAAYDAAVARSDVEAQHEIIYQVTGQRIKRRSGRISTIYDHAPVRLIEVRMQRKEPQ